MRIVVIGLGAIGGSVAAAVSLSGSDIIGVARGAHLAAIRSNGLRFRTPDADRVARFPTAASIAELDLKPDDAIVIATKTQHVPRVLDELGSAGVTDQHVFCAQNGVASELMALRYFDNVHGICVMMPCQYILPGEVVAFATPRHGIFDIGRVTGGTDSADVSLTEALSRGNIAGYPEKNVMASKYGKLLMNLGNIVEAAIGRDADGSAIRERLRSEAEAVLTAAGIEWRMVDDRDPRRAELLRIVDVPGVDRAGSSSSQSLLRRTGDIETEYLNGEIAYLARLNEVPAPANTWMTRLARRMVAGAMKPGDVTVAEIAAAIGLDLPHPA